jgi:hypothetical protein
MFLVAAASVFFSMECLDQLNRKTGGPGVVLR